MNRTESKDTLQRAARAIAGINENIVTGRVAVATLEELCRDQTRGRGPREAEVITLAFNASFAGTAAMFCVPVAGRGVFTRAQEISLNGIAGVPGPAPNERLGVVDTLIFAERRASTGETDYDGAALVLDLLHGKPVRVECLSVEGTRHERMVDLSQLEFARLYVYSAALPSPPLERPSFLEAIGGGARILLNGADGIVIGSGSRDLALAAAVSLAADLEDMDPALMTDGEGGAPYHTIAVAVPVLDASTPMALVKWAHAAARQDALGRRAIEASARLAARIRDGNFLLSGSDLPL